VGTNIDNAVVTVVMITAAPAERARRIAVYGAPVLYCAIGILVLAEAGTLSVL
jgi:hypothetical protein